MGNCLCQSRPKLAKIRKRFEKMESDLNTALETGSDYLYLKPYYIEQSTLLQHIKTPRRMRREKSELQNKINARIQMFDKPRHGNYYPKPPRPKKISRNKQQEPSQLTQSEEIGQQNKNNQQRNERQNEQHEIRTSVKSNSHNTSLTKPSRNLNKEYGLSVEQETTRNQKNKKKQLEAGFKLNTNVTPETDNTKTTSPKRKSIKKTENKIPADVYKFEAIEEHVPNKKTKVSDVPGAEPRTPNGSRSRAGQMCSQSLPQFKKSDYEVKRTSQEIHTVKSTVVRAPQRQTVDEIVPQQNTDYSETKQGKRNVQEVSVPKGREVNFPTKQIAHKVIDDNFTIQKSRNSEDLGYQDTLKINSKRNNTKEEESMKKADNRHYMFNAIEQEDTKLEQQKLSKTTKSGFLQGNWESYTEEVIPVETIDTSRDYKTFTTFNQKPSEIKKNRLSEERAKLFASPENLKEKELMKECDNTINLNLQILKKDCQKHLRTPENLEECHVSDILQQSEKELLYFTNSDIHKREIKTEDKPTSPTVKVTDLNLLEKNKLAILNNRESLLSDVEIVSGGPKIPIKNQKCFQDYKTSTNFNQNLKENKKDKLLESPGQLSAIPFTTPDNLREEDKVNQNLTILKDSPKLITENQEKYYVLQKMEESTNTISENQTRTAKTSESRLYTEKEKVPEGHKERPHVTEKKNTNLRTKSIDNSNIQQKVTSTFPPQVDLKINKDAKLEELRSIQFDSTENQKNHVPSVVKQKEGSFEYQPHQNKNQTNKQLLISHNNKQTYKKQQKHETEEMEFEEKYHVPQKMEESTNTKSENPTRTAKISEYRLHTEQEKVPQGHKERPHVTEKKNTNLRTESIDNSNIQQKVTSTFPPQVDLKVNKDAKLVEFRSIQFDSTENQKNHVPSVVKQKDESFEYQSDQNKNQTNKEQLLISQNNKQTDKRQQKHETEEMEFEEKYHVPQKMEESTNTKSENPTRTAKISEYRLHTEQEKVPQGHKERPHVTEKKNTNLRTESIDNSNIQQKVTSTFPPQVDLKVNKDENPEKLRSIQFDSTENQKNHVPSVVKQKEGSFEYQPHQNQNQAIKQLLISHNNKQTDKKQQEHETEEMEFEEKYHVPQKMEESTNTKSENPTRTAKISEYRLYTEPEKVPQGHKERPHVTKKKNTNLRTESIDNSNIQQKVTSTFPPQEKVDLKVIKDAKLEELRSIQFDSTENQKNHVPSVVKQKEGSFEYQPHQNKNQTNKQLLVSHNNKQTDKKQQKHETEEMEFEEKYHVPQKMEESTNTKSENPTRTAKISEYRLYTEQEKVPQGHKERPHVTEKKNTNLRTESIDNSNIQQKVTSTFPPQVDLKVNKDEKLEELRSIQFDSTENQKNHVPSVVKQKEESFEYQPNQNRKQTNKEQLFISQNNKQTDKKQQKHETEDMEFEESNLENQGDIEIRQSEITKYCYSTKYAKLEEVVDDKYRLWSTTGTDQMTRYSGSDIQNIVSTLHYKRSRSSLIENALKEDVDDVDRRQKIRKLEAETVKSIDGEDQQNENKEEMRSERNDTNEIVISEKVEQQEGLENHPHKEEEKLETLNIQPHLHNFKSKPEELHLDRYSVEDRNYVKSLHSILDGNAIDDGKTGEVTMVETERPDQKYKPEDVEPVEPINNRRSSTSYQDFRCDKLEDNKPQQEPEILDIHQHFEGFKCKPEELGLDPYSVEYIEKLKEIAGTHEESVRNFRGVNYSIDFFILDEKLMRIIEELDKIKSKNYPHLLEKKTKVINYVRSLHSILDGNAIDDGETVEVTMAETERPDQKYKPEDVEPVEPINNQRSSTSDQDFRYDKLEDNKPQKELEILDIHQHFEGFKCKPEELGLDPYSVEYIEKLQEIAATQEKAVRNFCGVNYSVEFFVLDEKLMKIVEELDKIKSKHHPHLLEKKTKVINYVRSLHSILDANVVDGTKTSILNQEVTIAETERQDHNYKPEGVESQVEAKNNQKSKRYDRGEEPQIELEILDIQHNFDGFKCKPEELGLDPYSVEYIEKLQEIAGTHEESVRNFRGVNYSTEFFVLDEKLMRIIEELDKIKSKGHPHLLEKKTEVIHYVRKLHGILDRNVIDADKQV